MASGAVRLGGLGPRRAGSVAAPRRAGAERRVVKRGKVRIPQRDSGRSSSWGDAAFLGARAGSARSLGWLRARPVPRCLALLGSVRLWSQRAGGEKEPF